MKDEEFEKLLKLAQMGLKPKSDTYDDTEVAQEGLNEAQKFIAAFSLRKGKNKVPLATVYTCYKKWAKEPLSKKKFLAEFGLLFIPKRTDQYRFYHLNVHPKTLMDRTTKVVQEREKNKKI
jgi:hypothetical protein